MNPAHAVRLTIVSIYLQTVFVRWEDEILLWFIFSKLRVTEDPYYISGTLGEGRRIHTNSSQGSMHTFTLQNTKEYLQRAQTWFWMSPDLSYSGVWTPSECVPLGKIYCLPNNGCFCISAESVIWSTCMAKQLIWYMSWPSLPCLFVFFLIINIFSLLI